MAVAMRLSTSPRSRTSVSTVRTPMGAEKSKFSSAAIWPVKSLKGCTMRLPENAPIIIKTSTQASATNDCLYKLDQMPENNSCAGTATSSLRLLLPIPDKEYVAPYQSVRGLLVEKELITPSFESVATSASNAGTSSAERPTTDSAPMLAACNRFVSRWPITFFSSSIMTISVLGVIRNEASNSLMSPIVMSIPITA